MSTPHLINLHELRRCWYDVLRGVTLGRTYLITRQDAPFARLKPYSTPEPVSPILPLCDDAVRATTRRLADEFTPHTLATLLGVTQVLLDAALRSGYLPQACLDRLDYLEDLVAVLARGLRQGALTWLALPRGELRYRSPLQLLQTPWMPDDPGPQAIRRLALLDASAPGR